MYKEESNTMNAPIAFTNMDMVDERKCQADSNEPKEVRETGIYEKSMDSLKNLRDIYEILELFRREIDSHADTGAKWSEPTSFVENVQMINDLVYAIKGDLGRLMKLFRQ